MKILCFYLFQMSGKYDAVDCECMWKNVLRPSINKKKWSSKEEEKLSELISKHNMRDWNQIAEELGVRVYSKTGWFQA